MKKKRFNSVGHLFTSLVFCVLVVFASEEGNSQSIINAWRDSNSLLSSVRKEAAKADTLPLSSFLIRRSVRFSYELTFERYLSYYRFKTRVLKATPEEIDECVERFDSLNAKEKGYLLLTLFIYEKCRRPLPEDTLVKKNDKHKTLFEADITSREERGLYVPYYAKDPYFTDSPEDVLFPYSPDETIAFHRWTRWVEVIINCLNNDEIAFDAYAPNQLVK